MTDFYQAARDCGAIAIHESFPWCPDGVDFLRSPARARSGATSFVEAHHRVAHREAHWLYGYGFIPKNDTKKNYTFLDAAPAHTPGRGVSGFVLAPVIDDLPSLARAAYNLAGGNMTLGSFNEDVECFLSELSKVCSVFPLAVYPEQFVCSLTEVEDSNALRDLVVTSYHGLKSRMQPTAIREIDVLIGEVLDGLCISLQWTSISFLISQSREHSFAAYGNEYAAREEAQRKMWQAQSEYLLTYPENPTIESIKEWMKEQPLLH